MKSMFLWLPGRWLVRRHLARLRESLETLTERVRDALAHAVGDAVASAVREAVRLLVDDSVASLPARPSWQEHDPDRPSWQHEQSFWNDDYDDQLDDVDTVPEAMQPKSIPQASRWPRAIAIGFQAAAWWLRRQASRFPVVTTLGIGLAASVAAYAASPLMLVTGAGVIGAALGLMSLTDAVRASAAAITP